MSFAVAAQADDCALVVAAYAKADATKRFAVYDVEAIDKPIKGQPFYVMMNGQYWVRHYDAKMVAQGYDQTTYGGDSRGASLAADVKADKKHCEPLGDKTAGSVNATGWLVRNNSKGTDFTALEFWIDKATGLPFYHGVPKSQGERWIYGDAVTPPK